MALTITTSVSIGIIEAFVPGLRVSLVYARHELARRLSGDEA
jgi:hypothetical protein